MLLLALLGPRASAAAAMGGAFVPSLVAGRTRCVKLKLCVRPPAPAFESIESTRRAHVHVHTHIYKHVRRRLATTTAASGPGGDSVRRGAAGTRMGSSSSGRPPANLLAQIRRHSQVGLRVYVSYTSVEHLLPLYAIKTRPIS